MNGAAFGTGLILIISGSFVWSNVLHLRYRPNGGNNPLTSTLYGPILVNILTGIQTKESRWTQNVNISTKVRCHTKQYKFQKHWSRKFVGGLFFWTGE